ncbi:MAG: TolC family protein [Bdellovibrionaceae bacterium]|nr:TolC family protein [Pseudobdellovibrionaceae bacterium]
MVLFLSLLLAVNINTHAATQCEKVNSFKEFYFCTLQKHPKFEISNLKLNEADAIVEKASQFENPDISIKSISGSYAGENIGSTELSLNISASQIWKRGPIIEMAEAEKKITKIESNQTLLEVKKTLIKDLYRLRQINDELELITETLTTFEAIQKQFKSRLAKGPEQEITQSLVELATGDYNLKKNSLLTERSVIVSQLKALWGQSFEITNNQLPPKRKSWPLINLQSNDKNSVNASLEVQKMLAETEKAEAGLKLARSESWPNVNIGPTIERTTDGPKQYYSYGVNANISLPILTINGGSRRLANSKVQQSKLISDYAIKRSTTEKEILVNKYNSSIESLKRATSQDEIKKKHTRVDSLFKQGLASGTLIIEVHRQINEFISSQHKNENTAIDSFLEIKTLSGGDIDELF